MTPSGLRSWKKISLFYILTIAFSAPFWWLDTRAPGNLTLITGSMWAPALAAIASQWAFRDPISEFGWRWGRGRYQFLGYVLPFLYGIPVYVAIWSLGFGAFGNDPFMQGAAREFGIDSLPAGLQAPVYAVLALTAGFIAKTGRALGEEIGWRGFLVPELGKVLSPLGAALLSGLMWALWHFPSVLWSDYNSGTPAWYAISCFTVMIVAVSVIAAWLTFRSQSLWPAVFLHGSHNTLIQLVLTPWTTETGRTAYFIDEFGVGLAIGASVVAVVLWRWSPVPPDKSFRPTPAPFLRSSTEARELDR